MYVDVATDSHDDLVAGVTELVQDFIDNTAYLVIRSPPAAVVDNDENSRDQTPCDEHDELLEGVAQVVQDFIDTTPYLIVSSPPPAVALESPNDDTREPTSTSHHDTSQANTAARREL